MRRRQTPLGLAILVLFQGPIFALLRWLLNLLPLPQRLSARWQWALRRSFWNNLARLKFRGSRPQRFPVPSGSRRPIGLVDFAAQFPGIPIRNITVADRIPWDEMRGRNFFREFPHKVAMRAVTRFQLLMYRWLSPMQPGLEEIAPDPSEALRQAYPNRHAALFEPPVMPLEFQGSLDLGALAVKGPYHRYLTQYPWGQTPELDGHWLAAGVAIPPGRNHVEGRWLDDVYVWDFWSLKDYEYRADVYNLGCRVLFARDVRTRTVRPIGIQSCALQTPHPGSGISKPGDLTWEFAKKLALCAATNHLSLVSHFNGIHLASGAHLAIATRNHLCPDHVLGRLLWPYIYHTQLSNYIVTLAQMVEGGDFESIFSFTYQGMCDLFSETYPQFDFVVNDPEADAQRRGIVEAGFDTPTQDDLKTLWEAFHRQAERYLRLYFNGNDAVLQNDEPVLQWLDALNAPNTGIPNGLPVTRGNVTLTGLARLLASFMYLVTVRHELEGSFLWNYQLWAHKQPPRLYLDGRRLPLDVYQRLVNANFNLNVPRTPLLWRDLEEDWSDLAPPQCGQQSAAQGVWREFQQDLERIEQEWRARQPWHVWRVYPSMLEVNIND
ncbi:lipoxygenase family protein [Nitrospira sp. Kam-Ns4a]